MIRFVFAVILAAVSSCALAQAPATTLYLTNYSVVPNDGIDHAADIQRAVNDALDYATRGHFARIEAPCGQIISNSPVIINATSTALAFVGCGPGQTEFVRTVDGGDVFTITGAGRSLFQGFSIVANRELTWGSFVSITGGYEVTLRDIQLRDPFVGIKLTGCAGIYIYNLVAVGGQYFPEATFKSNSRLIWLSGEGAPSYTVRIIGAEIQQNIGTVPVQNKYEHAVLVEAADDFRMESVHISGGYWGMVTLRPADGKIISLVKLTDVHMDFGAQHNLFIQYNPSGLGVRTVDLVNCTLQGAWDTAVSAIAANLFHFSIGSTVLEYNEGGSIVVGDGKNFRLENSTLHSNNANPSHVPIDVLLTGTLDGAIVTGNTMIAGANTVYNVQVNPTVTGSIISLNKTKGASGAGVMNLSPSTLVVNNVP